MYSQEKSISTLGFSGIWNKRCYSSCSVTVGTCNYFLHFLYIIKSLPNNISLNLWNDTENYLFIELGQNKYKLLLFWYLFQEVI